MPFQPGHKLGKGRIKGSTNRNSIPLKEKAKELGIDPFEVLLLFAKDDWKALGYEAKTFVRLSGASVANDFLYIEPQVRAKAAAEACQYLYPKLKSIEYSQEDPLKDMSPEEQVKAAEIFLEDRKKNLEKSKIGK